MTFAELTPSLVEAYVATGEPMDKAGGYGVCPLGLTPCPAIAASCHRCSLPSLPVYRQAPPSSTMTVVAVITAVCCVTAITAMVVTGVILFPGSPGPPPPGPLCHFGGMTQAFKTSAAPL